VLRGAGFQGVFVLGTSAPVKGKTTESWIKVMTVDGAVGYVRSEAIHPAVIDGAQDADKLQLVRDAAALKISNLNPRTTMVVVCCGLDRFVYNTKTQQIERTANEGSPVSTGRLGDLALVSCDEHNSFGPVYTGKSPLLLMQRKGQQWVKLGNVVDGVLESGGKSIVRLPQDFIERFGLRRHL
jgi:hypothetical protein